MRQIVEEYLETKDENLLDAMTSEEQRYVATQDPKARKAAEKAARESEAAAAAAAKEAEAAAAEAEKSKGKD